VRQRHRALRAAFRHPEFGEAVFHWRLRQRLPQRQHAQHGNQRLQQEVLDDA
jgi:hypothetical protein